MTDTGPPEPWTSEDAPDGAAPAATLIVLRDRPDGAPEVLMVQRAATMRFAANAIVFPGGRVDEGDRALAETLDHGLAPQDAAARIAAIRETIEEAGLAIGLVPPPVPDIVAAMRAGLHGGLTMGEVLAAHDLTLDLGTLTPFARWCPGRDERHVVSRIFDTRFYVARAPDDTGHATADHAESVALRWTSAAAAIEDCDAGREVAIFPTRRNLERLALGCSYAAVVDHARAHPFEMVTPWIEMREGEAHLCIPGHLGYPVTAQRTDTLRRG